jgi:hypothetical protein
VLVYGPGAAKHRLFVQVRRHSDHALLALIRIALEEKSVADVHPVAFVFDRP